MTDHDICPNCKANLVGEGIWDYFFKKYNDEKKADTYAAMYGADRTKGNFGRAIGIYDVYKDMTTQWHCPDCKHTWDRK